MKKIFALFLIVIVAVAVMVSCGDGENETTSTTAADGSVTTTTTVEDSTTSTTAGTTETTVETTEANDGTTTEEETTFPGTPTTSPDEEVDISIIDVNYIPISNEAFDAKIIKGVDDDVIYGVTITKWKGTGDSLTVPTVFSYKDSTGNITDYKVIQIGTKSSGTLAPDVIKTLVIEGGVRMIRLNTFLKSTNLETVTIGEGLRTIEGFAFWESGLKSIALPSTLKTIQAYAFSSCQRLESVVIPAGVESLDDQAFVGCTALKSVTMPRAFESRAASIFKGCSPDLVITYID